MRNAVLFAVAVTSGAVVELAAGQTIYLPVQYEYDASGQGNYFYYGGSDPLVFRLATAASVDPRFGRSGGFAFHSSKRIVNSDGPQIYSDATGPGVNAWRFGYTFTDARNAAYAAVPTYIRMSDQRSLATVLPDGTRIVPANAPGETVHPQSTAGKTADNSGAKSPASKGVIIIIPKKNLTPSTRPSPLMASARSN